MRILTICSLLGGVIGSGAVLAQAPAGVLQRPPAEIYANRAGGTPQLEGEMNAAARRGTPHTAALGAPPSAGGTRAQSSVATVPQWAGEASTVVQGRPNMHPGSAIFAANRGDLSRDEVRAKLLMRDDRYRAALEARRMGYIGHGRDIGVPATLPIGSPSVFEGGTPK